jgi:hypothetical protein
LIGALLPATGGTASFQADDDEAADFFDVKHGIRATRPFPNLSAAFPSQFKVI